MKSFTTALVVAYLCAVAYGSILAGSNYGASSQYSAVEESSSAQSSNVQQGYGGYGSYGGGYGGYAGGYGGYSGSSSVSQSYSSKVVRSSSSIVSQWPQLGGHPWFNQLCGVASNYKSAMIANQLIQPGFNFESTFSELTQRNSFLSNYIYATTGIQYEASTRSRFFSIVQQNPGTFLRNLRYFARHPNIFRSDLGRTLITKSSVEILQFNQQSALSYFQPNFLNSFFEYSSYRTKLAKYFNCPIDSVQAALAGYYQQYPTATLLLFRHIITRKPLASWETYTGFDYRSYSSYATENIYGRNPYYSQWAQNYGVAARSASFQQESYKSSSVQSAGGVSAIGGIGGVASAYGSNVQSQSISSVQSASDVSAIGGIGGVAGAYGSSVQSQSSYSKTVSRTSSSIISQWPQLGTHPWFGKLCGLGSNYKSAVIANQLIQPGFNFESTFTELSQKNSFLGNYIYATTGIQYEASTRSRFFGLVQQNPGTFLRSLRNFARHPKIFQSQLGRTLITKSSVEILQYNQQSAMSFFQPAFLNNFFEYKSYRSKLVSYFNCPEASLQATLSSYYQQYPTATLLLFRHILTRKPLCSWDTYTGFDYRSYSSYATQNIYSRNPYYSLWGQNYGAVGVAARSASFQQESYQSQSVQSAGGVSAIGGIGGVASAYGSSVQSQSSKSVQAASGVSSIGGIGGVGGVYGNSIQSQSSYSKTVSRTSSSIVSQWPQLGSHPWFGQLCGLGSNYKSAMIANQLIQPGFNFESTFSELTQRNSFLSNYIYATTGIQYEESTRSRFFGLVQQNPGSFLRSLRHFARHPKIFTNELGQALITKSSVEILQYNQQSAMSYFQPGSYVDSFLGYSTYRKALAGVFGCSADYETLSSYVSRSYSNNPAGMLLLFRHIITRKSLYSFNEYLQFNHQVYASSYANRMIWRRNPYIQQWRSYGVSASSYKRSSSAVRAVRSRAVGYGL